DPLGRWPAHLAAENSHKATSKFLFEAVARAGRLEGAWMPPDQVAKKVRAFQAAHPDPQYGAIQKLAAELTGLTVDQLNDPEEVIKYATHLERLKGFIAGVKSEGWWQHKYLPQRIRSLLTFLTTKTLEPKEETAIIREISSTLDALRWARRKRTLATL